MNSNILGSVLILCGFCSAIPKPFIKLSRATISDLEGYVNDVIKCRAVTGLALTLVKGEDTIYTGGFGVRDIETKAPMTETTLLNIGSETKAFTSTLAADAVARKLIKWDEPMKNIFPAGFRLQDNFRSEKATMRDFLSHRLGMPSYWGVSTGVMNLTLMEISQRLKDFPVLYGFRDKFLYSNYLFVVAAAAVENATGETWAEGVYNNIFKPLNMTGSRVSTTLTEADWSNMAYSNTIINSILRKQNPEKELLPIIEEIEPAGGVYSNAVDMAKWLKFHISGGKDASGHQVIPRCALTETHKASMTFEQYGLSRPSFPVDFINFAYALGWVKGVYNGYAMTSHGGRYIRYATSLTLLPDAEVGVWVGITGSKRNGGDAQNVLDIISMYSLDLLLGETPWLNSSTACTYPSPWKQTTKTTNVKNDKPPSNIKDIDMSEYIGDYVHPAFGTFHVTQEGHQLKYNFGHLLRGNLNPKSVDQFHQTLDFPLDYRMPAYPQYPHGFPITFARNHKGLVTSVTIPYMEFDEPPVFTK